MSLTDDASSMGDTSEANSAGGTADDSLEDSLLDDEDLSGSDGGDDDSGVDEGSYYSDEDMHVPTGGSSKDAVRRLLERADISTDILDDEELDSFLEEGSSAADSGASTDSSALFNPQQFQVGTTRTTSANADGTVRETTTTHTKVVSNPKARKTPQRPSKRNDVSIRHAESPETSGIGDLSGETGDADFTPKAADGAASSAMKSHLASKPLFPVESRDRDGYLSDEDSLFGGDTGAARSGDITGTSWLNQSSDLDDHPSRLSTLPRRAFTRRRKNPHESGLSGRRAQIQAMVDETLAKSNSTQENAIQTTFSELVESRAQLQKQLAYQAEEHQRYRQEVRTNLKTTIDDIRRRQAEVLRKIPQVREELKELRSYLDGDLTISDQLFLELKQVEVTSLTPRQLILLRVHEHLAPVRRQAERASQELAQVITILLCCFRFCVP